MHDSQTKEPMVPSYLNTVDDALDDLRAGRPVVVVDAEDRENEGDLIASVNGFTADVIGFIIRHSSGLLCAAATAERLDSLTIPLMVPDNRESMRTAFTVTVDAARNITTGISASDRATTLRVLADQSATADDLVRPGHTLPLRSRPGGVLTRPGHTEATVDLARLADLPAVGVLAEIVHDDGSMMRVPALRAFATEHRLAMISIADLIEYRLRGEDLISLNAKTQIPTQFGLFTAYSYVEAYTGLTHVALLPCGREIPNPTSVRVHSECITGEAFHSQRCDCGAQLDRSLETIQKEGGVLIYLRGQEGRGIGLSAKMQAYELQDAGLDTVDANLRLGLPIDARDYWAAAQILRHLKVTKVDLLTNNPRKVAALNRYGLDVIAMTPLVVGATPHNESYLATKQTRLGHRLPADETR